MHAASGQSCNAPLRMFLPRDHQDGGGKIHRRPGRPAELNRGCSVRPTVFADVLARISTAAA